MPVSALAGQPADPSTLVDVPALLEAYYEVRPDPGARGERVSFGTSGHRGSSLRASFNEAHILVVTEAICRYRNDHRIAGPLFLGRDTHALSEPAFRTALRVLAAHGVDTMVDAGDGFTPTPVISHAILAHNLEHPSRAADGIVITPSHNPPEDGGIKYNPPSGGPADTGITDWIEAEANALLAAGLRDVQTVGEERAAGAPSVHRRDYLATYVGDLPAVVDLDVIRSGGLKLGVDPLGGSSLAYWIAIGETYRLNLEIVNRQVDPTFGFMPLDWDGRIRMDCSSPHAMAGLIRLRDRFDVAMANDPDADRHGIVTRDAGLLNPNDFLAVAIAYLFEDRRHWPALAAVGKTVVSSSLIDRVVAGAGRRLVEVPVGFKWFVDGLLDGTLGFGGEETAGASFLRRSGSAWSTDKDGLILCLLAAEMTCRRGRDPGELYRELTDRYGTPAFTRIDAPATADEKSVLKNLSPSDVQASQLAGEEITAVLTEAPGNGAAIGGLKVRSENGWFAARPSGTEDVYKIYAETFLGEEHLGRIVDDAQRLVASALATAQAGRG